MLVRHRDRFKGRDLFLDVGGFHGSFSALFLETGVFDGGVIFEPNPDNLKVIRERFKDRPGVEVIPAACGDREASVTMYCRGPAYTGSVLPYADGGGDPVNEFEVPIKRLDDQLDDERRKRIGFIKIDTQGHDLQVLAGATRVLEQSRPWVITEMIYTDLYENQCHPHEITAFLAERGYVKAAEFSENYSEEGWLAWSDACFVPREEAVRKGETFARRPTCADLARRVRRKPLRSFLKLLTGRM